MISSIIDRVPTANLKICSSVELCFIEYTCTYKSIDIYYFLIFLPFSYYFTENKETHYSHVREPKLMIPRFPEILLWLIYSETFFEPLPVPYS